MLILFNFQKVNKHFNGQFIEVNLLSWEILDENTLNKIKKQKDFEDQTAKSLKPLYESAKNPLIKTLIHSLILDTTKHSETYQMLIDLNSTAVIGKESKDLGKRRLHVT